MAQVKQKEKAHIHTEYCAIDHYRKELQEQGLQVESEAQFEKWVGDKIIELRNDRKFNSQRNETVYQIPVVVHVIHNGEPVGVGPNISEAQVLDGIRILNEDFRRLNADANQTKPEFQSVAGDARIEFVLAKQDPEGLPTNGIIRTRGTQQEYGSGGTRYTALTDLIQWPADDYVNIYTATLGGNLGGFAQFPISDIPGLTDSYIFETSDLVCVDYRLMGSIGSAANQYEGRVLTHEFGHYFGLRHTWGDGDCSADDFVADTPNQGFSTSGCPTNQSSCGSLDQTENYMDYTFGQCQNMFSLGQIERFHAVIQNAPRRTSLLTSKGLIEPYQGPNDAGVISSANINEFICNPTESPLLRVRNFGDNAITSLTVEFSVAGSLVETITFPVNIDPLAFEDIDFSEFDFSNTVQEDVRFVITEVNGVPDANPDNNLLAYISTYAAKVPLTYVADLSSFPAGWTVDAPTDNSYTWEFIPVTIDGETENVFRIENYRVDGLFNKLDYLIMPPLDLTDLVDPELLFEVSYAPYPGFSDGLFVLVSLDCGSFFPLDQVIFGKTGNTLATTNPTQQDFIPTSSQQFRFEVVDLSALAGLDNVRLAFVAQNGRGNNIYVKDFQVNESRQTTTDLTLRNITSPNTISCAVNQVNNGILQIENSGDVTVTTFRVNYSVNGQLLSQTFSGIQFRPGEVRTFNIGLGALSANSYDLDVTIASPNGRADDNPADNNLFKRFLVNNLTEIVPFRERFDAAQLNSSGWRSVSPTATGDWAVSPVSSGGGASNSVFVENFGQENIGQEFWLVSPTFDLSDQKQASIFFDRSYAFDGTNAETLEVRVTTDCGNTYETVYSLSGAELANANSSQSWTPGANEWTADFVDLTEYAGNSNVRIIFVVTSAGGNNLYLDNLEFFLSNDQNPVEIPENTLSLYPNPTKDIYRITFNLPELETVNIQVVSMTGVVLREESLENVLNQTYYFDGSYLRSGLYLLRITSPTYNETLRLMIER
ncbi:T9SS-dependent choice-of-anchor J family protein [Penaeicola halotolerans]|uniref:T9SS-dependent choice-of-anchor J family protein n=1 Tax=Penaeicola halotolerans TaxID=2793196 RepID=UPI001CF80CAD|nr:choice-of-anchor J domain-containing protein [Penaeicola halotolerans]